MSHRERDILYDDRESHYSSGPPRRHRAGSDTEVYERYEEVRRDDRRMPVRERERERDTDSESRLPSFMRREEIRRPSEPAGPLVLRQREVETVTRPGPRSPSQVRFHEERSYIRRRSPSRSPSPPPVRERVDIRETKVVERERRSPSVERVRSTTRIVDRERDRDPSPIRYVRRGRSPSVERERIRIIERSRSRERMPSPSPSPPPPPPVPDVIRAPTIEREVITHYKNIDHGTIHIPKPRSPPAPLPRPILKATRDYEVTRDTEIDISRNRDRTEVDIHETRRRRSVSRDRGALVVARPRSPSPMRIIETDRERKIRVDIDGGHHHRSTSISTEYRKGHGHTHSLPPARRSDYSEEADRIKTRIDSRGRMGEAWNGTTRDWTIVDVPPGTDRVRMDGAGGGAAEVTWQRYNGVRRSKFIPERERDRDDDSYTTISDRDRSESDRLAVEIRDKRTTDIEIRDKRTTDIEIEKTTRRRTKRPDDMWTEITKDLVCREAIIDMGYDFEETDYFFYVMQYLRYEDVLRLVEVSDEIRRHRRRHLRDIEWEREARDTRDVDYYRRTSRRRGDKYYERELEVDVDREVVYDRRQRGYLR